MQENHINKQTRKRNVDRHFHIVLHSNYSRLENQSNINKLECDISGTTRALVFSCGVGNEGEDVRERNKEQQICAIENLDMISDTMNDNDEADDDGAFKKLRRSVAISCQRD
jgi:hypothetical protein